jgi:hypothetical protein
MRPLDAERRAAHQGAWVRRLGLPLRRFGGKVRPNQLTPRVLPALGAARHRQRATVAVMLRDGAGVLAATFGRSVLDQTIATFLRAATMPPFVASRWRGPGLFWSIRSLREV